MALRGRLGSFVYFEANLDSLSTTPFFWWMSRASKQTEFDRNSTCIHPTISNSLIDTVPFYLSFLLSCLLSAASTSDLRTCPYSLTRLGSIRYIHRCISNCSVIIITYDNRNIILPDKGRWETRDHLCYPSLITVTIYQKGSHTGNKPNDVRMASWYKTCIACLHSVEIYETKKSYAKKSSTTVDKVLYIIAFIGICATLCVQLNFNNSNVMTIWRLPWVCSW